MPAMMDASVLSRTVAVRFERSYRKWTKGMVAGFPSWEARQLVDRGVATLVQPAQATLSTPIITKGAPGRARFR